MAVVFRHFVRQVQRDVAGRETWWLGFLRTCKGIKARPCSLFLGLLRLPAAVARQAARREDVDALVKELVAMADHVESKLVDEENIDDEELEEGFLLGVENQITKSLRMDVMAKTAENKKLKTALQEKEAALQEKEAALQEKYAENQRLKDEINRLKTRKIPSSPKPGHDA
jgi:hypothetical protein